MPGFTYSLSKRYRAPFLLEHARLIELEGILDEIWAKLCSQREREVTDERDAFVSRRMEEALKYGFKGESPEKARDRYQQEFRPSLQLVRCERHVTAYCRGNKWISGLKLDDIHSELLLSKDWPLALHVILACGRVSAVLSIEESSGDFHLRVEPEDSVDARSVFSNVRSWVDSVRPNILLKIWSAVSPFHVWLVCCWFIFAILFPVAGQKLDSYKVDVDVQKVAELRAREEVISDAHRLLADGFEDSDEKEAIRILLSLETGYVPDKGKPEVEAKVSVIRLEYKRFLQRGLVFLLGILVACVLLSFKPRTAIGLGDGDRIVKRRQRWVRLATYVIPAWVFTSVVLPRVVDWLKGVLST